jgi:hypothetical protein
MRPNQKKTVLATATALTFLLLHPPWRRDGDIGKDTTFAWIWSSVYESTIDPWLLLVQAVIVAAIGGLIFISLNGTDE